MGVHGLDARPKQDGGIDCGVYVSKYMDAMLNGISLLSAVWNAKVDVQTFRYRMAHDLSKGVARHISEWGIRQRETDGQSERTIQKIEDMLRVCAIDFKGSWDEHLPLVEFAYNNSYHASIGMPPYEALYGRKCRSPVYWDEVGERKILGPELVQQTKEVIEVIQKRLIAAQDRQRKYANQSRKDMEFEEGNLVFLKVSP
ncbi:hypothetical protein AgCh_038492 [Apium graveolens]